MKREAVPALLFVPGSDTRKLAKLWELDVPAFVLDLEDAVAASRKRQARELVGTVLDLAAADAHGRQLFVRINALDTAEALADLHAVVRPGLTGLLVPKVRGAHDLQLVDWVLDQLERERGLKPGAIETIALLETAGGLLRAREIAGASRRLGGLCLGAGDLSAELGIELGEPPPGSDRATFVTLLKAQLVLASSEAGLRPPHAGVYSDFRDLEGLRSSTEAARALGFYGRHAIHPAQIPVIQEVFRPREEEIAWARKLLSAFEAQEADGVASMVVDGEFVDYAIAARARRVLRRARSDEMENA